MNSIVHTKVRKPLPIANMLIHTLFILVSLAMIVPFLLIISISLTKENEITLHGYQLFLL